MLRVVVAFMGVATKYLCPYLQNPPEPHFRGPFNAKLIIERAVRKSHVNGATKLKLYSYIGIGKYLSVCRKFSARRRPGTQGPLMYIWDPLISRKLLELEI